MNKKKKLKRPVASFIILTNIIFLPLFFLVGAVKMLGFPTWVFDIVRCLSAWSSTFAFAILFSKIYPGQHFLHFVKQKFKNQLRFSVILSALLIQATIFMIILLLVIKNTQADAILTISSWGMLSYFFFKNLLSGPIGEELGWRGFALLELQKKYGSLQSAIIIGFWWGIWHLPIWFTTGLTGLELLKYIIFFMLSIISTTIIMTAFYTINQNLIIPIMIHQFFNFFIGIINENLIILMMYNAILYSIAAFLLILMNPKKVWSNKPSQ
ncbi:CPBP family intramembrane glutamic endopeptidase [Lysinibacillus fusiformis]|uniref:CPBP family intramembrane glutamic endopeptidase n=1 Tax=Lysinibacillus fusiformis TaxID=28031 RepID=UPI003CFA2292